MILPQKTPKNYECKICDFVSRNQKDYNRHLMTRKHQNTTKYNDFTPKNPKLFSCECGKEYPYRSSLYNHRKNCKFLIEFEKNKKNKNIENIENIKNKNNYEDLLLTMIKENKVMCNDIINKHNELKEEISKTNIKNQIIGDNNIINKNKLNINIFLNEQCKDALTMNEFIDKIKISLDNLLITKEKGISEGLSNILIENMNKLSLHQRPMHCTDVKRETVYIKYNNNEDKDNWIQDNENIELKEALKKVTLVQQKNLDKWTKENPNWNNDPILQQEYIKLVKNCTDDIGANKRTEKIVKKVCNTVFIGDVNND